MPVTVQSQGDTVAIDDLPEHHHVAVGIFLVSEHSEWDRPCGVVDGADESQAGASAL